MAPQTPPLPQGPAARLPLYKFESSGHDAIAMPSTPFQCTHRARCLAATINPIRSSTTPYQCARHHFNAPTASAGAHCPAAPQSIRFVRPRHHFNAPTTPAGARCPPPIRIVRQWRCRSALPGCLPSKPKHSSTTPFQRTIPIHSPTTPF